MGSFTSSSRERTCVPAVLLLCCVLFAAYLLCTVLCCCSRLPWSCPGLGPGCWAGLDGGWLG